MTIQKASLQDINAVAALAAQLRPENTAPEMAQEFEELLQQTDAAVFLANAENNTIGFAQCQLRRDYVEGTKSSPVGYLEGIYVQKAYRRRGTARALLAACECWAKKMGCAEFGSDCELSNTDSQAFHQKLGFTEANRIVCYTKQL